MNIKNLKTVTITLIFDNTDTSSAYINIPFNAQYYKIKYINWFLAATITQDEYLTSDTHVYPITSSLTNHDILASFAPRLDNNIPLDDPVTERRLNFVYSGYLNTLFKLNNQIINGVYTFDIPIFETYTEFSMLLTLQLEFIEYK